MSCQSTDTEIGTRQERERLRSQKLAQELESRRQRVRQYVERVLYRRGGDAHLQLDLFESQELPPTRLVDTTRLVGLSPGSGARTVIEILSRSVFEDVYVRGKRNK